MYIFWLIYTNLVKKYTKISYLWIAYSLYNIYLHQLYKYKENGRSYVLALVTGATIIKWCVMYLTLKI